MCDIVKVNIVLECALFLLGAAYFGEELQKYNDR